MAWYSYQSHSMFIKNIGQPRKADALKGVLFRKAGLFYFSDETNITKFT